jgi:hypothetical protein
VVNKAHNIQGTSPENGGKKSLRNNACDSDYREGNNCELAGIWKEAAVVYFEVSVRHQISGTRCEPGTIWLKGRSAETS